KYVEDEDVMYAMGDHHQAAEQRLAVDEQVGDDHDQAAALNTLADLAEELLDVGLLARAADGHRFDNGDDVDHVAAGRQHLPDVLVEGDHADRVLLAQQQISEAGPDGAGVLVLVERTMPIV